ncbi:type IV pilus biogenesis/stability protein PilW [Piscinibacter sp.]|jgi:type IV pilus assembly protein PilF|uniref:type IV pilus biogenesis/stability protein PilW n=1 Tax=Piscinibacter sp. TaxID=1903157 RepID=UPI003559AEC8
MTSRRSFERSWRLLAATLAASALLTACAGTAGPATPQSSALPGESKDRVTASDEPESSKRARVRMELASAYFARGQMTTALDEVKLAIAADPTLVAAFNLRGLIYASLGDDRLAEESFRHALRLDARDADTMQNFGWYLCQQKRFDEAEALFNQALAMPQYRDSPRTLLTQGICHARAGQWADAERSLQRSYELDPSNPATAVNLTEVLFRRGELERARFYIRRVNGSAQLVNAQTLWLAARIEHRLGNRQGERELGSQLRDRFPQSREAAAFDQGRFDD